MYLLRNYKILGKVILIKNICIFKMYVDFGMHADSKVHNAERKTFWKFDLALLFNYLRIFKYVYTIISSCN